MLFITKYGQRWAKDTSANPISAEFRKLLQRTTVDRDGKKTAIYRRGLGFYALRHTFQTVGDGARDPVAVQAIMGHSPSVNDMGAVYREGISDERLKAVTDHIYRWLFGRKPACRKARP